jgi:CTD kinase subunit beta
MAMAFATPSNGASSSAMPTQQQQAGASQQQPEMDVSLRAHIPFFNPVELEHMSAKARGKMSENVVAQRTAAACGFIEALGARMGL